jgi:hypothetical protein
MFTIAGKFICNIYNPSLPDAINFIAPNIADEKKRKMTFKLMKEYIDQTEKGEPKATSKLSVEQLKERNIIGLYTKSTTKPHVVNFLKSEESKKNAKKYDKNEFNTEFNDIYDEPVIKNGAVQVDIDF